MSSKVKWSKRKEEAIKAAIREARLREEAEKDQAPPKS
jgi:hypothetical protein